MESRASALAHLRKEKRSGRDMDLPVKKVTVMADSKEGLAKGLDTAEDIVEDPKKMLPKLPGMMDMLKDDESEETPFEDAAAEDDMFSDEALMAMSQEELVDIIKDLKEKLKHE